MGGQGPVARGYASVAAAGGSRLREGILGFRQNPLRGGVRGDPAASLTQNRRRALRNFAAPARGPRPERCPWHGVRDGLGAVAAAAVSLRHRGPPPNPTLISAPMPPLSRQLARWPLAMAALATAALLALSACQRDRLYGERKPIGKAYHAFTSKYNAYFNANELVEEAEAELAAANPADYNDLLPVYPAYAVASAQSAAAKLDEAMEKLSMTVNVHRPNAFEDDAYLLLARAQLLKQDYETAQHTLEYSVKDFAPENEATRLRRIEKERIEEEKARAKANRDRDAPKRRASHSRTGPQRRRTAPQRRKSSRSRKPSSRRKKSPERAASRRSKPKLDREEPAGKKPAGKKAAPKKRKTREEMREEQRAARLAKEEQAGKGKKDKGRKGKPKTRAQMAKEQREARLAEEKAALKAEQRAARDAERAAQGEALVEERRVAEEADRRARRGDAAGEKERADAASTAADADAADAGPTGASLDGVPLDGRGLAAADDEERPRHGIFVHEKAMQDFEYWLARTYVARERYLDAERLLGRLARSGATWKRLRRRLPAAYADMYLRRGMLAEAVPYLGDAVAMERNKADRARYAYLLGQVQQRLGDAPAAVASFREVVDLKPAFDLAFNAELNLLTTSYEVGEATPAATLKRLTRMSKEEKYDVYRDQVFYEMADIALTNGDRDEGIAYMRQALDANAGNARQAARGYRRLAELFLGSEEYVLASAYFDSTSQVLPQEDPTYAEVVAYRDNLRPIAASLTAIARQDSLLAVAAMAPEEQRALALAIDKQRRERELAAAIAQARQAAQPPTRGSDPRQATRGGLPRGGGPAGVAQGGPPVADFFAYDSKDIRRGQKEFRRRWGDRQLVDDWRTLSARESLAAIDDLDELRADVPEEDVDVEGILADVPNTPEARAAAHAEIAAALLALGRDYRDELANPERAAEALAELLRRYPGHDDGAEALYLLALAQDDLGRAAAAAATRERLQREHADSKYARSLAEPDFFDEAKGAERALVDYYDETYRLFRDGDDAAGARARLAAAPERFGEAHALMPRFALLGAQVAGKLDGRDAYVEALQQVAAKYPDAEESAKARDILRLLGARAGGADLTNAAEPVAGAEATSASFDADKSQSHYFLAVLPKGANMSESRVAVSDFNGEHHRLEKLAVSNVSMVRDGAPVPVVVVRRFKTATEAMAYYESVVAREAEFLGGVAFEPAVISQANYREVLRKKSFGAYLSFFAENY